MPKKPLRIDAGDIDESLLSEVLGVSREVGWDGERTEIGDIMQHLDLMRSMEKRNQARKDVIERIDAASEKVEAVVMSLAYQRLQAQARPAGEKPQTPGFRKEEPLATGHELKHVHALLKKMLESHCIGFWRDIERHFSDKRMVQAMESYIEGKMEEKDARDLAVRYLSLPFGVSEEDSIKTVELWFISNYLAGKPAPPLPSYCRSLYDFMRGAKSHNQQLAAYIAIKQTAEGDEKINPGILSGLSLKKMDVHRSCMLLSIASEYQNWINSMKTLLKVDDKKAAELVDDIIRHCCGEATTSLKHTKVLGGENTVVRLDFGGNDVLFFRFGDARSHALGYHLLKRYGFPTPDSCELHASMCNLEAQVSGPSYGKAHKISRENALSLGRLLAACFIFGIPDPNMTNFISRGIEIVKIDAESAPYGWNYYSGGFIGDATKAKPNDSYGFSRLLKIHPGSEQEIRAGFIEGLDRLKSAFTRSNEINALCDFIEKNYSGAYIYRASGEGLDEKVIARLRKRLEALVKHPPGELLEKAERGQEIR